MFISSMIYLTDHFRHNFDFFVRPTIKIYVKTYCGRTAKIKPSGQQRQNNKTYFNAISTVGNKIHI